MRRFGPCLLLVALVGLALGCGGPTGNAPPEDLPYRVEMTRLGAGADADPSLQGPSLLLQGDGTPLDTAFQAHAERAYLVHGDHPPETMAPGTPLTYSDVQIVRLNPGTRYDLTDRLWMGATSGA